MPMTRYMVHANTDPNVLYVVTVIGDLVCHITAAEIHTTQSHHHGTLEWLSVSIQYIVNTTVGSN